MVQHFQAAHARIGNILIHDGTYEMESSHFYVGYHSSNYVGDPSLCPKVAFTYRAISGNKILIF